MLPAGSRAFRGVEAVHGAGDDGHRRARPHHSALFAQEQSQSALEDVDRLVLDLVVLEAEALALSL